MSSSASPSAWALNPYTSRHFLIGVISKPYQARAVGEFFELFKTAWEPYCHGKSYDAVITTTEEFPEINARLLIVCGVVSQETDRCLGFEVAGNRSSARLRGENGTWPIYRNVVTFAASSNGTPILEIDSETAGLRSESIDSTVVRLGYDPFDEVQHLLSTGQPVEWAHVPTLEIHIEMLRAWILSAGIALIEILPVPAEHDFIGCLTHDIDFVGIRNHKFDHSMWGFVYRATIGGLRSFVQGRLSFKRLLKSWSAVASLPFVFAGWVKDFWEPFEWYLEVEKGLPATYFLIPFKRRAGQNVPGRSASRRATAYDIADLPEWTAVLQTRGCELGVHGLDAWHDSQKGLEELARITAVTAKAETGIRMHWLLQDSDTPVVLEKAGYAYDSTSGYNDAVGYRAGTTQVFQPLETQTLLELPMHIQDGALFYPKRLGLSDAAAEQQCQALITNARKYGGVLTLLWHDRSHGPERFWGDFYIRLLESLKTYRCWFGSAAQVVGWFRKRRGVRFEPQDSSTGERTTLRYEGEEIHPPLKIRLYRPTRSKPAMDFIDIAWDGKSADTLAFLMNRQYSESHPGVALSSGS